MEKLGIFTVTIYPKRFLPLESASTSTESKAKLALENLYKSSDEKEGTRENQFRAELIQSRKHPVRDTLNAEFCILANTESYQLHSSTMGASPNGSSVSISSKPSGTTGLAADRRVARIRAGCFDATAGANLNIR